MYFTFGWGNNQYYMGDNHSTLTNLITQSIVTTRTIHDFTDVH
jgi:hypothetical protein